MRRQGTRDTIAIGMGTLAHTRRGPRTLTQQGWGLGNSGTRRQGVGTPDAMGTGTHNAIGPGDPGTHRGD